MTSYLTYANTVLSQGRPIPFSHPAIKEALKCLFFDKTGVLGYSFAHLYEGRYPLCAIAFVLAWVCTFFDINMTY
jgi:hypothetical protein